MKNHQLLTTPEPPPIQLEIPPASLDLGPRSSTKNRRKGRNWMDRYPVKSSILMLAGITAIVLVGWLVDCKLNSAAHSQTLSQGLHQLFIETK